MSMDFRIGAMLDSSVLHIYSQKHHIRIDPPYQREGDVWTREKQQLLIDSVINGFDMPKLYFHEFSPMKIHAKRKIKYAIVDGRQRLQAIWDFIDNAFPLSPDFEYLHEDGVEAGGLTYGGLAEKYPSLKIKFDSRTLPIMSIQTDDIELIEEMFSRLNEAVPLNAAEKRNAWGGAIIKCVRELVNHDFFKKTVKVSARRYKHHDIAAKFLLFEHAKGVVDTKKVYIDDFVRDNKNMEDSDARKLQSKCEAVLDLMSKKFANKDALLASTGWLSIYYHLFRLAEVEGWYSKIQRNVFESFENELRKNREFAENDISNADYNLLEFGRLSQSPNDSVAIKFRLKVLEIFVRNKLGLKKGRGA